MMPNKETILGVVRTCIERAGYAPAEADKMIRILCGLSVTPEDIVRREETFWRYTDYWGAEGPDCMFAPG
jgi:hypothetical protein